MMVIGFIRQNQKHFCQRKSEGAEKIARINMDGRFVNVIFDEIFPCCDQIVKSLACVIHFFRLISTSCYSAILRDKREYRLFVGNQCAISFLLPNVSNQNKIADIDIICFCAIFPALTYQIAVSLESIYHFAGSQISQSILAICHDERSWVS